MIPCTDLFRSIILVLVVGCTWAQEPDDAQRKAKLEAERRQLGTSPRAQPASPRDAAADYAQRGLRRRCTPPYSHWVETARL